MNESKSSLRKPWYQNELVILCSVVIFFPLGLFLMWKYTRWDKVVKVFATLFVLVVVIGMATGKEKAYQEEKPVITEEPISVTSTPTSEPLPSPTFRPEVLSVTTQIDTTDPNLLLITKVIDGDTVELENGQRVRYIGIDTPETKDPNRPVGCYGEEAYQKNKSLVEGKRVRLEKDVSETDKYGRLLRYVYIGDQFINELLVKEGFANASSYPPDIKHQELFKKAEKTARESNLGLWSEQCKVIPSVVSTKKPIQSGSNTSACSIKGNINSSGEKIYHVQGCRDYNKTVIESSKGERFFCSEEEAVSAGWRKAKNC